MSLNRMEKYEDMTVGDISKSIHLEYPCKEGPCVNKGCNFFKIFENLQVKST